MSNLIYISSTSQIEFEQNNKITFQIKHKKTKAENIQLAGNPANTKAQIMKILSEGMEMIRLINEYNGIGKKAKANKHKQHQKEDSNNIKEHRKIKINKAKAAKTGVQITPLHFDKASKCTCAKQIRVKKIIVKKRGRLFGRLDENNPIN